MPKHDGRVEGLSDAWHLLKSRIPIDLAVAGLAGLLALGGITRIFLTAQSGSAAVRLTREVAAFTVIGSSDVEQARVPSVPAAVLTDTRQALGRFSTRRLAKGALLTETAARFVPWQWRFLTVPLGSTPQPEIGDQVILVGVSSVLTSAFTFDNAIVESISESHVVVAVPDSIAKQAATYLTPGRQLLVVGR